MAQQSNKSPAVSKSEERIISEVIKDISDYDTGSLSSTYVRDLDGDDYHPLDRKIGGSDENTYQTRDHYKPKSFQNTPPKERPKDK